jgi:biotin operon repressor
MNPDIEELIKSIEDQMVKNLTLDAAETRLYYHLLRHSRLMGKHEVPVSVEQLASSINCSKNLVKDRLKSLKQKGIIEIINTGWYSLETFSTRGDTWGTVGPHRQTN